MDEVRDRRYIKEIINEYTTRFVAWGPPDSWDLDQFKTLENMIQEATNVTVNANTLKRFFQQRTGNPQLATRDALCSLLGYAGYTDFVIKKTRTVEAAAAEPAQEKIQEKQEKAMDTPAPPPVATTPKPTTPEKTANSSRLYIYLLSGLLLVVCGYLLYTLKIKEMYTDYLLSKIEFSVSNPKGANPLTVTFSYNIPAPLLKNIKLVYEEANGDTAEKHLARNVGKVNATYIQEGDGKCILEYNGRAIKTLTIENRKQGWSVYTRNERKGIFRTLPISEAYNKEGYASLPLDSVVPEARPGHLFVSYVYYKEKLVDGDNFIYEARVRNSAKDYAIPRSDVMMYILSSTGMHGFALNEAGFAYIKFISSEKMIKGDEFNLSNFNFNASEWHVMGIRVENKKSSFYLDGQKIYSLDYTTPIGMANELILRFKGCGAVDYVKITKLDGQPVYEQNFDQVLQ
ncbi:hypothetical protein SAMN05660909_03757 [Chitinophaga terrae (ex Kim and Jung 2007)]|uniref:Uncharacterized protein n=1 Tax=Chitinophaga terrae (ex Kim and Jung 2007) TaxID=408074 RepID=A0A1H4EID5_9BACT|nr:hypothetical protein [Chitinophaga terrae (ex Kim and Jung 2007)]MDQ0106554.1 hypothetical protein [Chitinophaga terrae (ex Kim and Jung 2007)]GEP91668.1 hypothetical protein CTE07_33130 [Chitinophaga terrae (ex Kim and Jung 2007)]SEA84637.1 hypothetical protein SAMN05660909_03757 [Chitinophaga terrae (ex Kim and Jung 2007)]